MADIIVAPGGDDGTGDGSPEAPYASLRAALDAAGPQGTVIASDGTYDYLIFAAGDAGASGTPTTLKAANKWGARIVPSAGYHGINMQAGANWITVDGFDVSGTATDRDGIKCDGDDCVITNCRIHDCGQNGVLASGARVTVSSCLIYSNGTDALDHGIYSSSVGATYKANVVRVNTGYGLHLYGVSGVTGVDVYNNVSYGNGISAILVQGPGGGEAACDNVINNNYFEIPAAKTAQVVAIRACNTAVFANNIVITGTGYAVQESEGTVSTTYANNQYYTHTDNQNTHDTVSVDELLTNGNFETVTGDNFGTWAETVSGSSTITDDGVNAHAGSHCPKLHIVSGASAYIRQSSVMTVGRVYTLEFWAKASDVVGISLDAPSIAFSLTTTYQRFIATFVATSTSLTLVRGSGGNYDFWIDDVSLKQAYGPELHSVSNDMPWPVSGSRVIDAGNNTYKPAVDFWGRTPPATIQIGAFPYVSSMCEDQWDADPLDFPDAYVSNAGSDDTGDGTPSSPFASMRAALTAAGPGGTVTVQPGTYDYFTIAAGDSGIEGAPTTIKAATKWATKIVGTSGGNCISIADNADWIVVDGFELTEGYDGICCYGGDSYVIKNCWAHDNRSCGIETKVSASGTVERNLCEDNGTATTDHGIYIAHDNAIVRNNLVRRSTGYGIHCYKVTTGLDGLSVYGNVSYDNVYSAMFLNGDGDACTNVIANNCFSQSATNTYPPITLWKLNGCVIANNVIVCGTKQSVYEQLVCSNTVYESNLIYKHGVSDNTHTGEVDATTNLVTNGTFEAVSGNDFTGWVESAGITDGGAEAAAGSHCVKMGIVDGANVYIQTTNAIMTAGAVYTLTFKAKASEAGKIVKLETPSVDFVLSTTYQNCNVTFVAGGTKILLQRVSSGTYDIYIDDVVLTKAYGPEVHGIDANCFWPKYGSRVIDAGNNTYKPAVDFWGETPPTTVQIGAFPYTEKLHPRTMLHDPWNITKVNRRWWNWRQREQTLKPG